MNKLLLLGIIVVTIGLSAAFLAFKFLPAENDLATGAVLDTKGAEVNLTVENPDETAEPQAETKGYPDKIVEGMTMDKVKDLAGDPVDKQTITTPKGNTIEYWYYQKDGTWQIGLSNEVVSVVRKY
jgi:hypothetical protein